MGDEATAQDVVQEAYLKVWRNAHSYHSARGTVKASVLAVVHHQAIDVCRAQRATVSLDSDADMHSHERVSPENTWEAVNTKLDKVTLTKALEKIPI